MQQHLNSARKPLLGLPQCCPGSCKSLRHPVHLPNLTRQALNNRPQLEKNQSLEPISGGPNGGLESLGPRRGDRRGGGTNRNSGGDQQDEDVEVHEVGRPRGRLVLADAGNDGDVLAGIRPVK
jgi:hypothetical protein